jgi:hypothetical protein
MIRSLGVLMSAAVLALVAAAPAPAQTAPSATTALVRAAVAQTTDRPVRQLGTMARATPRAGLLRADLARLAPTASIRPQARPAELVARAGGCRSAALRACARPIAPAQVLADLPRAAPGQVVIVTDGRTRVHRVN